MKTTLRKRYSSDFKAQIVDLFNLGKTVPQLAEEFGVGSSILYRWVQPSSSEQPAQFGSAALRVPQARDEVGEADELRRLRAEVTHLRMENDILKKAAVILGTQTPSRPAR
jgi:transposase